MTRWLKKLALALVSVAALLAFAVWISPWPGVIALRLLFGAGADSASTALQKHVPADVETQGDIAYEPDEPAARLDIFRSRSAHDPRLPTIVWIHGGAWLSGHRSDVANYLKVLAGRGYTTITVGYTIAPGATYPTPVRQVNRALRYLTDNAAALKINASRIVLAGDSAGAQIAAQSAALITSPDYAAIVRIAPGLQPATLRGVALFCGPYDLSLINFSGPFGLFLRTVAWAYSGTPDFRTDPVFSTLSVLPHLTGRYPPAYISAGNADPLLPQSQSLAAALCKQSVPVTDVFFPADHKPPLAHEYQFNLDEAAGREALTRLDAFLRALP